MDDVTQFLEAVKGGDLERVRALLAASPELRRAADDAGLSVIMLATYYSRQEIVEELVVHGIPLDIFEAAATGRTARVVELLDEDPARANAKLVDGFTPLGLAAFFGHEETLALLIDRGADVNAASENEMCVYPLHSAVAHRQPAVALAMADRLLRAGSQVNVRQRGGITPLHQAAAHGHLRLIRLLLQHGADPQARSEAGQTPRDLALENGHAEAARLLLAQAAP